MLKSVSLSALLLAGCAAAPPPQPAPGPQCNDSTLGRFVGQTATAQLGAQMLVESNSRVIRWVQPGQMVTMDFSPVRLTVRLDGANRVESATCG